MDVSKLPSMIVSLIGTIAVIDLVALLLASAGKVVKEDQKWWIRALNLGLVGGIFGIYATVAGYKMDSGAVVSIRDVGPLMAGLLSGPLGGLIAGVIAGVFRLLTGLPDVTAGTSIPCAIATVCIGVISGCFYHWLSARKNRGGWGLLFGFAAEVFHLILVFIYKWIVIDVQTAWSIVESIGLQFILSNSLALGLMFFVLDRIKRYQNTEVHAQQVENELGVATAIQDSMLPKIFPDFPGRKEFAISASMDPAKEVGGDFYDFFFTDDDHFVILIADVSGKGVPAALFMVIAKTLMKNNLQSGLPIEEALTLTNQQLLEGDDERMFVTCWAGMLELSSGRFRYVNCGHNPPLFSRQGQKFEYLKSLSGFVLAGSKKSKYKAFELNLQEGDRIFLYTDGITEAMNLNNEQYGEKRLLDFANAASASNTPEEAIPLVMKDVQAFTAGAEQSDDMTMLAFRMNGFYHHEKFMAKSPEFDRLSQFVNGYLSAKYVPPAVIGKVDIILDEIFSNIVKYSGSEDLDFGIFCERGLLSMSFLYGGDLYDITAAKEPDVNAPLSERKEGGLGLFIVRKFSDKVTYEARHGHNYVVIDKKF